MGKGARTRAGKAPLTITTVAVSTALLAACATPTPPPLPPPPPPPPPPPVEVERVPFRPLPPGGAAYVMEIPQRDQLGQRQTVNRDLTNDEIVWHFRSAWNVAALNCTSSQYDPILAGYSAFISDHSRALRQVNNRIDAVYRREIGNRRQAIRAREAEMTAVYNFFALPPARAGFCRAALDIANRAIVAPPEDGIAFAMANFAQIEAPFEQFFVEYERYQQLSADWDAQYGERYGASQPGWVAAQEARWNGAEPQSADSGPAATLSEPVAASGAVTDPETGVAVPVVPVQENFVSQPVTQPIASDEEGSGSGSQQ